MSYYLAPSLMRFREQLNERWPNRDKTSDGWIGDTSHQARKSDHNPDYDSNGVVRALDIDIDGIDVAAVLGAACGDNRTSYVIYNRRIWNAAGWAPYTGSNPHTAHIHVSLKHTKAAEKRSNWSLAKSSPSKVPGKKQPTNYKDLKVDGVLGNDTVSALQIVMRAIDTYNRDVDGNDGKYTWIAVQTWLRQTGYYPANKWVIDGDPGPETIKALQRFLAKRGHLDTKRWAIDGDPGPETIKALQRYLNTQN